MRIYENLDLCKNYINNSVIGTGNDAQSVDGAIKWDSTAHILKYAYNNSWLPLGGNETTTNYVSGKFTLGPATTITGTSISTSDSPINVFAANENDTNSPTALKCKANNGKLTIGTSGATTDYYFDLNIGKVYYSIFNVSAAGTRYVTIQNPFQSQYVIVNVYQVMTYKDQSSNDRIGYEKIMCEIFVKDPSDNNSAIELTLNNVVNNTKYMVVIAGGVAEDAGTVSGTATVDENTSRTTNRAAKTGT